jgi:hypothetical protein
MMQSVQVIIERLKTNPEDFFGDADSRGRIPKFSSILDKLDNLLTETQDGHVHRLWFLEPEEKAALIEAYKEARRTRFEAQVFHDLLSPQEELNVATRQHPRTGKTLMQGSSSAVTSQSMVEQTTKLIREEFDKQYAKNRNPRP